MDTLEYMKLVCGILTVIITYGGFRMYTDRRKYIQEVEKLKAEVRDAQVNTRGSELDNVQKAMQILMDEIVEPLKQEINAIRKELGKPPAINRDAAIRKQRSRQKYAVKKRLSEESAVFF